MLTLRHELSGKLSEIKGRLDAVTQGHLVFNKDGSVSANGTKVIAVKMKPRNLGFMSPECSIEWEPSEKEAYANMSADITFLLELLKHTKVEFDRRVTELLAANNTELQRRRDAETALNEIAKSVADIEHHFDADGHVDEDGATEDLEIDSRIAVGEIVKLLRSVSKGK